MLFSVFHPITFFRTCELCKLFYTKKHIRVRKTQIPNVFLRTHISFKLPTMNVKHAFSLGKIFLNHLLSQHQMQFQHIINQKQKTPDKASKIVKKMFWKLFNRYSKKLTTIKVYRQQTGNWKRSMETNSMLETKECVYHINTAGLQASWCFDIN